MFAAVAFFMEKCSDHKVFFGPEVHLSNEHRCVALLCALFAVQHRKAAAQHLSSTIQQSAISCELFQPTLLQAHI